MIPVLKRGEGELTRHLGELTVSLPHLRVLLHQLLASCLKPGAKGIFKAFKGTKTEIDIYF
jgi:hypothetical protein